jgi:hypothetical protein
MSFGGGSKQSGTTTTVVNKDPWAPAQDYLKTGFGKAQEFLDNPIEYYPNSTVVPFSGQTEQSLQMGEDRALAGSPGLAAAQQNIQDTSEGNYLNSNPYMDQAIMAATRPMAERFADTIIPGIQSGFNNKGRLGGGLQAYQQQVAGDTAMRNIGEVAGSMAYKGYGDERNRMMQGATLAPGLALADYGDIDRLGQIGQVREGLAGAQLQESIDRYTHEQTAPRDELARFMSTIGGGQQGSSGTTAQPIYSNKTADALGTVGSIASIGNTFGFWG